MENSFERIPDRIKPHLQEVTKSSGLPDDPRSLEAISEAWLEKRRLQLQERMRRRRARESDRKLL